MNEEARKYIENLREKFERECDCPGDLKRRQELLVNARHATTISDEDFTKVEMEHAAFKTHGSFEFGFYVGARWADEHQKSPWKDVEYDLPEYNTPVLLHIKDDDRIVVGIMVEVDERLRWCVFGCKGLIHYFYRYFSSRDERLLTIRETQMKRNCYFPLESVYPLTLICTFRSITLNVLSARYVTVSIRTAVCLGEQYKRLLSRSRHRKPIMASTTTETLVGCISFIMCKPMMLTRR